jgi:hypothetical protein
MKKYLFLLSFLAMFGCKKEDYLTEDVRVLLVFRLLGWHSLLLKLLLGHSYCIRF